jgi:hypothetical protein
VHVLLAVAVCHGVYMPWCLCCKLMGTFCLATFESWIAWWE